MRRHHCRVVCVLGPLPFQTSSMGCSLKLLVRLYGTVDRFLIGFSDAFKAKKLRNAKYAISAVISLLQLRWWCPGVAEACNGSTY